MYEFKLPDLGEGLTEGEIARWLVAEGDEIGEDQPLVEIATDKTTVEIPSPAAGKVTQILVGEGEVVPVGTLLVVIGGGEDAPRATPQATPVVRRIAKELGVALDSLRGTGPGGRITESDVRARPARVEARVAASASAACAARSRSTSRARTARYPLSHTSKSATSLTSTCRCCFHTFSRRRCCRCGSSRS